jgi:hypothetical protein
MTFEPGGRLSTAAARTGMDDTSVNVRCVEMNNEAELTGILNVVRARDFLSWGVTLHVRLSLTRNDPQMNIRAPEIVRLQYRPTI